MQWPVTRIALAAVAFAVVFAVLIHDYVPGGSAIQPTLRVLIASVVVIVVFRAWQRSRGAP